VLARRSPYSPTAIGTGVSADRVWSRRRAMLLTHLSSASGRFRSHVATAAPIERRVARHSRVLAYPALRDLLVRQLHLTITALDPRVFSPPVYRPAHKVQYEL
jgi:hypothetical protein